MADETLAGAMRACTKCGEVKPRTAEHFYRDRTQPDGLCGRCRVCTDIAVRDRRAALRGTVAAPSKGRPPSRAPRDAGHGGRRERREDGLRVCARCGEAKPHTEREYSKHPAAADGLGSTCRDCRQRRARELRVPSQRTLDRAAKEARAAEGWKVCTGCGADKPATPEHFSRHPKALLGLSPKCKECMSRVQREHYARNRDRVIARTAQNAKANPEARRATVARYRERYPDRSKEQAARQNAKNWADPGKRLSAIVSHGIRMSLKGRKLGRRWESLVGYTLAQLRTHLERQFRRRMTWENAGEWHIDHILPLASFSFSSADDPDFRAAWALHNLRPLWAGENMSKGAKRLTLL